MYETVKIPKFRRAGGRKVIAGTRTLRVPNEELKAIQTEILVELKSRRLWVSKNAHGFVRQKNPRSNAAAHVGSEYVLRIDLANYFPTTSATVVLNGMFRSKSSDRALEGIVQNWCFDAGFLPQGAPTSPMLSNYAALTLDQMINSVCNKWRMDADKIKPEKLRVEPITYTRYADDLVFSSDYPFLYDMRHVIYALVKKFGWKAKDKKTLFMRKSSRQVVTGITVNEQLSTPRPTLRGVRARLHNLILDCANGHTKNCHELVDGTEQHLNQKNPDYPFAGLDGQITQITYINPSQGERLSELLAIAKDVHLKPNTTWSEATNQYVNVRTSANTH